jgi:hypothetical protein
MFYTTPSKPFKLKKRRRIKKSKRHSREGIIKSKQKADRPLSSFKRKVNPSVFSALEANTVLA